MEEDLEFFLKQNIITIHETDDYIINLLDKYLFEKDCYLYFCIFCQKERGVVYGKSYQQQGNITGKQFVKGMEKIDKYSQTSKEQKFHTKLKKLTEIFEEYLKNQQDYNLDTETIRNSITHIIKQYNLDNIEETKTKIVIMLFNDLKNPIREICNLNFHLSLLRKSFKIKKDISYLLTNEEQIQRILYCLKNVRKKILTENQIKLFEEIENDLSIEDKWINFKENENLTLEQISAILKFIFIKDKMTAGDANDKVEKLTGVYNQKYTNQYKILIKFFL